MAVFIVNMGKRNDIARKDVVEVHIVNMGNAKQIAKKVAVALNESHLTTKL